MVETNTVLCSGTTFGSRDAVLGYVSVSPLHSLTRLLID